MHSASARFYGRLAHNASDQQTRKLFIDMVRVEQMIALEIDSMASQLCEEPLPEHPTPRVDQIKTAPEWLQVTAITLDVALSIALDCTRRGTHHSRDLAAALPEPGAAFFRSLASGDEEHARLLEDTLAKRLQSRASRTPPQEAVLESLASIRRSAQDYALLERRASRPSVRSFFNGMAEVCALHAADFDRMLRDALGDPLVQPDDTQSLAGLWEDRRDDMPLEDALRLAMYSQKRAALHHGMLARTYPDPIASVYLRIAESERRHAATIASVLDRIARPDLDLTRDTDAVSPLVDAPRESWTASANTSVRTHVDADETIPPTSLRLLVG